MPTTPYRGVLENRWIGVAKVCPHSQVAKKPGGMEKQGSSARHQSCLSPASVLIEASGRTTMIRVVWLSSLLLVCIYVVFLFSVLVSSSNHLIHVQNRYHEAWPSGLSGYGSRSMQHRSFCAARDVDGMGTYDTKTVQPS